MTSSNINYLVLSEVLRKINMYENYRPSEYEHKVVADFLKIDKPSHKRSKKETKNIQQILYDRIFRKYESKYRLNGQDIPAEKNDKPRDSIVA